MILRQKSRNKFLFLVLKLKHDCSCCTRKLALTFLWTSTNKVTGTQFHHKLILYSSWHIPRVLVIATKVEKGTIRVGNEQLLVITSAFIAKTVTQRATGCHYRWYIFLLHWIIQSSIYISRPRFVNSHPTLHITLTVITGALISSTVTQRAMSCHHRLYQCLLQHRPTCGGETDITSNDNLLLFEWYSLRLKHQLSR